MPSQTPDCANRGEESGEPDCVACTVHGSCHRAPREVEGVKSCVGCADGETETSVVMVPVTLPPEDSARA